MLVPCTVLPFLSVHSYIRGFSAYLLGGVSIAQTPQILPRPSGFHTAAKLWSSSCIRAAESPDPEHTAKSRVNRANGNLIASGLGCATFQPKASENFRAISLIIT
ncbi:uncharacterized [Tachysurus ichikawai]